MHRRDWHFLVAEVAMTATCVACAALSALLQLWHVRRLRDRVNSIEARADVVERTCADAAATALAAYDGVSAGGSSSSSSGPDAAPAPVVQGYGQTRSRTRRYVYADVRYPDGEVRREWIGSIPLQSSAGGLGGIIPPVETVNPHE